MAWVVLSPKFFVLRAKFLQDLLVADLAAGNAGEIIEGGLTEGNVLGGKSAPDIAQLAVILGGLLWVHNAVLSSFSNLRQNGLFFTNRPQLDDFIITFYAVTKLVLAFFQCL